MFFFFLVCAPIKRAPPPRKNFKSVAYKNSRRKKKKSRLRKKRVGFWGKKGVFKKEKIAPKKKKNGIKFPRRKKIVVLKFLFNEKTKKPKTPEEKK